MQTKAPWFPNCFLRSERSLIQTIGRAARNVKGKAILYGDKITGSMQKAIDVTNERREIQQAYNKKHNITPKGVQKRITDIMEGARGKSAAAKLRIAQEAKAYKVLTPNEFAKQIKKLEKQMYQHAKDLEFEQAANLRDEIEELQQQLMQSDAR